LEYISQALHSPQSLTQGILCGYAIGYHAAHIGHARSRINRDNLYGLYAAFFHEPHQHLATASMLYQVAHYFGHYNIDLAYFVFAEVAAKGYGVYLFFEKSEITAVGYLKSHVCTVNHSSI
jgi:hypothetical protein